MANTTCALCMVAGTSNWWTRATWPEIPRRPACSLMARRAVSGASSSRLNCGSSLEARAKPSSTEMAADERCSAPSLANCGTKNETDSGVKPKRRERKSMSCERSGVSFSSLIGSGTRKTPSGGAPRSSAASFNPMEWTITAAARESTNCSATRKERPIQLPGSHSPAAMAISSMQAFRS